MRLLVLAFLAVAAVGWADERHDVGATIPSFALEDQHGVRAEIDEKVGVLVLTRDMDGGDVVKQALADEDQAFLDGRRAAYVADVSRMPALVTRFIAVPRMRDRRYRILLDRKGEIVPDFPVTQGKPTVVRLDRLRIVRIEHPGTPAELRSAITADR
jgi:hypothetical protein